MSLAAKLLVPAAANKNAAPVAASSGSKKAAPAAASSKKSKVDFTWGGRPNPTPETTVVEKESFLNAAWRYNKK